MLSNADHSWILADGGFDLGTLSGNEKPYDLASLGEAQSLMGPGRVVGITNSHIKGYFRMRQCGNRQTKVNIEEKPDEYVTGLCTLI